jgi:hypothetical protein
MEEKAKTQTENKYYLKDNQDGTLALMMDPGINCVCPLRSPVVVQQLIGKQMHQQVMNSPCTSNCTHFQIKEMADNRFDVKILCCLKDFIQLQIRKDEKISLKESGLKVIN